VADDDTLDSARIGQKGTMRHYTIRSPWFGWLPWDRLRGGWRLRLFDFRCFEARAAHWAANNVSAFDVIQLCELPFFLCRWKEWGIPLPVVMRLTAGNFYDPCHALQRADGIIASGMTIPQLRQGPRPDAVDVPNAVDVGHFRPQSSSMRANWGYAEDDFLLLYVARFQAFKNHEFLLQSFRFLLENGCKARLILAGSGPLKRHCENKVRKEGISQHVRFLSEVPFKELPQVYAACDVKVITSTFESFCFAALEAMATALPIITTDCGWVPELIQSPVGGLVVDQGDMTGFAKAVRQLRADPVLRKKMGRFNRKAVEQKYQWEDSTVKLEALYRKLVRQPA
jgi:glycosyltransferase involved in cell wall biosynthesis